MAPSCFAVQQFLQLTPSLLAGGAVFAAMSAEDHAIVAGGLNAVLASTRGTCGPTGSESRGRSRSARRPSTHGRSHGHGGSKSRGRSRRRRSSRSSSRSSYSSYSYYSYSSNEGRDLPPPAPVPPPLGWSGKYFSGIGLGKRTCSLESLSVSMAQEALHVYAPDR